MIFLKFYFTLAALLIISMNLEQNCIVVVGQADNSKGGAVVVTNHGQKVYFLEGLDSWDPKIYGKKVKVWGNLFIEEIKEKPQKPGLPIPQQMPGTKRTILKPKWKLFK